MSFRIEKYLRNNWGKTITKDFLKDLLIDLGVTQPSYKKYVALITQSSTDAPTAVVLENTLSGTISFNYVDVGTYDIVLSGGTFTANKTIVLSGSGNGADMGFLAYRKGNSQVRLLTYSDFEVTAADDILHSAPIEIRVYN